MALGCTVIPALNNRKFAVKIGITQCLFAKAALAVLFLMASADSDAACVLNVTNLNTTLDESQTGTVCLDAGDLGKLAFYPVFR